jgi:hypothetical protein
MRFDDSSIASIGDLLEALKRINITDEPVWYRGQSAHDWPLKPSIAREARAAEAEFMLMKRFKQNALRFLENRPITDWDWLFLMQHYGAPTRLLDWTESPLVALYFAVDQPQHHGKDGALWCLLPKQLNVHAGYRPAHALELPFVGTDDIVENYLPQRIVQERSSDLNPIAAMSVRESPRLFAQLGVFTITHRQPTAIEAVGDGNHVWRFTIPHAAKPALLADLAFLSINRLTLFPELTSVAAIAAEVIQ